MTNISIYAARLMGYSCDKRKSDPSIVIFFVRDWKVELLGSSMSTDAGITCQYDAGAQLNVCPIIQSKFSGLSLVQQSLREETMLHILSCASELTEGQQEQSKRKPESVARSRSTQLYWSSKSSSSPSPSQSQSFTIIHLAPGNVLRIMCSQSLILAPNL